MQATCANGQLTGRESYRRAAQGIHAPVLVDVPVGSLLFRFIDIHRHPSQIAANSPWWVEYQYFEYIRVFAQRHDHPLERCVRLFLAVLHEYSELTGFVSSRTRLPLKAWRGIGSVQYGGRRQDPRDPMRMIPMQSVNTVYQLYIPGLQAGSTLLNEAFGPIRHERMP